MRRNRALKIVSLVAFCTLSVPVAFGQETTVSTPPPYHGVNEHIDGVFVTPVPDVAFSATAELESTQVLSDGSTEQKKTFNNIARDSTGRIYNERRSLVPPSFTGTPRILSVHLYDPQNRLNTFLDPATHIARQSVLTKPVAAPTLGTAAQATNPLVQEEDLGGEIMENVTVHGTRKRRTIPGQFSGTGKPIVVTDEYWYSDDLHLNMLVKHDDPRTGEQTVTITNVSRTEPEESMFQIPTSYKVVDETPVSQ
jgi:hypothetical protein